MARLRHFLYSLSFVLLGMGCGEGSNNTQTVEQAPPVPEPLQANLEAAFLMDAHSYGLILEQYNRLAAQKATTPTIRSFAELSLQYHQSLNKKIAALAAPLQLSLPSTVGEDVQAYQKSLEELPSEEFEKRYLQVLSEIQPKMISSFEKAAEGPIAPSIKSWILETLPNLRAHAQTVADLQEQFQ